MGRTRHTVVLAIAGPIAPEDLPGLCTRASAALGDGARIAVVDVATLAADAGAVEALARLRLLARRRDVRVRLVRARPELRELIALLGLDDVLLG